MNKSLKSKMLGLILTTTLLIYVLAIGYISLSFRKKAMDDAKLTANAEAKESANMVKAKLSIHFGVARGLAQAFSGYSSIPVDQRREIYSNIMRNVLIANPEYIAVFEQWEISAIDKSYDKSYGRIRNTYYQEGDEIFNLLDTLDLTGDDSTGIYYYVKSTGQEIITHPYYYTYTNSQAIPQQAPTGKGAILEATIIVPVMDNNKFVGMTGMDIPLENFQQIIEEIKSLDKAYTFLIANNGRFVAHPSQKMINKSVAETNPADNQKHNLLEKIQKGEKLSFMSRDAGFSENSYVSFIPLKIGNTSTPWSLGIVVPVSVIMKKANQIFYIAIIAGFFGILILTIVIYLISHNITKPLKDTTLLLKNLARGNITDCNQLPVTSSDELGEMTLSANTLLKGLNSTTSFANKIGKGDLDAAYGLLSKQDTLGNALINMRNQLKESNNEIQQQSEELKEINKELAKLSIVASETDNAILIMDPNANVEWVNEGFTKLYGFTNKELITMKGNNLRDFSANPNISEIITHCLNNKQSVVYTSLNIQKTGKEIWAQTTMTPILDRDGTVIKLVTIDSEISKIKEAEQEIARQRDNLKELNAAKDKFFSIIAHDLKNPFSVLLSVTEALIENYSALSEGEKNVSIQKINKSANLLYNLLDNLLQWAMSQTGRIKYEPAKMDIGTVVAGNISVLQMNAEKKKIKLCSEVSEKTYVHADMDMIKTVVRNLLVNAIKFNKENGEVRIKSKQKNGFLEISIEDTGIGLSLEDQNKLFRIDVKNKTIGDSKEKGTGLGLILSKEYIEKNGGKIWIKSKPGQGSSFIFSLPAI